MVRRSDNEDPLTAEQCIRCPGGVDDGIGLSFSDATGRLVNPAVPRRWPPSTGWAVEECFQTVKNELRFPKAPPISLKALLSGPTGDAAIPNGVYALTTDAGWVNVVQPDRRDHGPHPGRLDRGAVSVFRPIRLLGPPPERDVPVSRASGSPQAPEHGVLTVRILVDEALPFRYRFPGREPPMTSGCGWLGVIRGLSNSLCHTLMVAIVSRS